jgi:ArsR family transcriptional regulator
MRPPLLFTHPPLGVDDAYRLADALRALADPARLQLLSLLATFPDEEARQIELRRALGRLTQSTVSHHMTLFVDAGLVERRQESGMVFYRLRPEPYRALLAALALDGDR